MNDLSYPLPVDENLGADVGRFLDSLSGLRKLQTSFDPLADWANEQFGARAGEVLDAAFKAILNNLRDEWNTIDKPLTALEDLVIDFRSSPWMIEKSGSLLQEVAGISEYDGEDEGEQGARRERIYRMICTDVPI